eukprot:Amastigsp_a842912_29.p1 type:complete len:826 gc:universal Amastigsp_a842912_29:98-2575(+)
MADSRERSFGGARARADDIEVVYDASAAPATYNDFLEPIDERVPFDQVPDLKAFARTSFERNFNLTVAVAVAVALAAIASLVVAFSDGVVVLFVMLVGIGAAVFGLWLGLWVLARSEGPREMVKVSTAIRLGAEGYFRTQYTAIAKLSLVCAGCLFLFYNLRSSKDSTELSNFTVATTSSISFLLGALCSGVSGFIGMWMSVRANVRVAAAARSSYNDSVQIAIRGGGFAGLLVVTTVVVGITTLFVVNRILHPQIGVGKIPHLLTGFGFGASLVALFAQLGGGIYTKGADVGADLVGKVEAGIPEDDPRNPAVIADLVGDNVGDCAGRGADLFESISAEIVGSMIIAASLTESAAIGDRTVAFMFFPLVIHALDLVISTVAFMLVRTTSGASVSAFAAEAGGDAVVDNLENPITILKRGFMYALGMSVASTGLASFFLLHSDKHPSAWWRFALCGYLGVGVCFAFLLVTQYYTDYAFSPVRQIALAANSGHGTTVIIGMAKGLESTCAPILVVSVGLLVSYGLGESAIPGGGLFGTAVATMGMLSSAVYVLAADVFGPICDNSGGIAEMSHAPAHVRAITDSLDAVGNVTKAITKGYSVGSAGLASFLLFRAFMDVVNEQSADKSFTTIDFAKPPVFVGALLGAMLVFLFSSYALAAVGVTATRVVEEVRRQFAQYPGIMNGTQEPDYSACVSIVAACALREMIRPGLLAVLSPIVVGFSFRFIGGRTGSPLLGPECVAGFLMSSTIAGLLLSLTLNNAGGAWDNAKKYIETGHFGGKGSDAHKAAVTGDTVGDPFKDTAGPSLHVLIKLLATISLVLGPVFIA